ncbi:MAG: HesA/MoeB/ThiF family protein [Bacteroidota bacterium]
MLNDSELERYTRQIRLPQIGIDGQEKLKKAKVLVIGAGGLGSAVLQYLAAAGIGNIGIVDFDTIDLSNFNRQVLYSTDDLGSLKVMRAAERIGNANPDIKIIPFLQQFTMESAEGMLLQYDIVVDCTDQFSSRYLISDACVRFGKPEVYGAVYHFEGQVTVFNYQNGPNLRDLHPEEPPKSELPPGEEGGIIGTIAGIIGILEANEVIKIVLGIGEVLSGKILVFDALNCNSYFFHLSNHQ